MFFGLSSLSSFPSPATPLIGHSSFTHSPIDPTFLQAPQELLRVSVFDVLWLIPTETLLFGRAPLVLDNWRAIQLFHFVLLPKPALFFWGTFLGKGLILRSLSTSYKSVRSPCCCGPSFLGKVEGFTSSFYQTPKRNAHFSLCRNSLCSKYRGTIYKIIMRCYRNPSVLEKRRPQTDGCWRCSLHPGTILHILGMPQAPNFLASSSTHTLIYGHFPTRSPSCSLI